MHLEDHHVNAIKRVVNDFFTTDDGKLFLEYLVDVCDKHAPNFSGNDQCDIMF